VSEFAALSPSGGHTGCAVSNHSLDMHFIPILPFYGQYKLIRLNFDSSNAALKFVTRKRNKNLIQHKKMNWIQVLVPDTTGRTFRLIHLFVFLFYWLVLLVIFVVHYKSPFDLWDLFSTRKVLVPLPFAFFSILGLNF
jgi:hypothetical protein